MVNTKKTILRDRTRLRRSQNPQQIDFKRMRKARAVKTAYWAMKRKSKPAPLAGDKKEKAKKEKPKKEKKPELEVIEEEPDTMTIDEELEEIYSLDDEDTD